MIPGFMQRMRVTLRFTVNGRSSWAGRRPARRRRFGQCFSLRDTGFRIAPLWWSHVLGLASLLGLGVAAEVMTRRQVEEYRPRMPWIGMLIAAEWHMLWAAVSGMETALYTALATALIAALVAGTRNYAALGLLTGLSVWVRPDGLTLIGPVLIVILLGQVSRGVADARNRIVYPGLRKPTGSIPCLQPCVGRYANAQYVLRKAGGVRGVAGPSITDPPGHWLCSTFCGAHGPDVARPADDCGSELCKGGISPSVRRWHGVFPMASCTSGAFQRINTADISCP